MLGKAAILSSSRLNKYLISRWKLDETSGSYYYDTVGSNHGSPAGGLVIADDYVSGVLGNAVLFNGTSDRIDIPYNSALNFGTNNFTITAWIKLTSLGEWSTIFAIRNTSQDQKVVFRIRSANDPQLWCQDTINSSVNAISPSTILANTWYHIAGVRDGNSVKVYVDGVWKVTASGTLSDIDLTNIDARISSQSENNNDNYFHGIIDDLRIYNKALTVDEINLIT